jgi:anhydro-N-acetylmuramic acid kinase
MQTAKSTSVHKKGKILTTGGGAFNEYLIDRIKKLSQHEIILPDENTINFKEALIFAFLGVLRWREETNCLRSVTGAKHDNSGGVIYLI